MYYESPEKQMYDDEDTEMMPFEQMYKLICVLSILPTLLWFSDK